MEDCEASEGLSGEGRTSTKLKGADESVEDNNYLKLRQLLLGDDYASALNRYISKEEDAERVAKVLAKAIHLSNQEDASLGDALAPVVDQAIGRSIEDNPQRITNIIFPIMGPAIRKAVSNALTEMIQSLNTLLEQSLTLSSLNWRVKAWRSGIPYAQYVLLQTVKYRVEQVFLVHHETGLLLHSVTAKEVVAQDPELVSSMLTAISDFVSDSFSASDDALRADETLERIRFGQLELLLFAGPHAILALAVRGNASDELTSKAHRVIESIHERYAYLLAKFDGDRSPFDEADSLLSECLISQKVAQAPKRKPWLAICVLVAAFSYFCVQQFNVYQHEGLLEDLENNIRQEKGYVVLEFKQDDTSVSIEVLRSPESRLPDVVIEESNTNFNKGTDNSTFIKIDIKDTVVHFGPLPKPVPLSQPKAKTENELYRDLVARVESSTFYFEPKATQLTQPGLDKIPTLINDVKTLEHMTKRFGIADLQIIIMGFADNLGTEYGNKTVSQKRADTIRSMLVANGIASNIMIAWGVGNIDHASMAEKSQRRVNILVTPKLLQTDLDSETGLDSDPRPNDGALK